MISTCSHKNLNNSNKFRTVAISGNKGNDANYKGNCYPLLAPKKSFWQVWHENIGKIPENINNMFYIEQYYIQVLSKLDPIDVYNILDNSLLLCYEDSNEFCHRHIVAAWFELFLEIEIPEVVIKNNEIVKVDRPYYIKPLLEQIIRKYKNMKGFNLLSSLYLYEKGEHICAKAIEIENRTGIYQGSLRKKAEYYKNFAYLYEDKYIGFYKKK